MAYDVIVIGAGLGGLAASAALAQKGKKVLVLEQHATVGGLAAGFKRKGYYFDAGMSRVNSMSIMMPIKKLGIFAHADFASHRSTQNIEGHGFACDTVSEYFERLGEVFPDDRENLARLYREQVHRVAGLLVASMGGGPSDKKPSMLGMLVKMPALMREATDKGDFNDVLAQYLDRQGKAYLFLLERWEEVNYRGRMNRFMRIGKIHTQMCNAYPIGGFQAMCDRIAAYIKAHGGTIQTASRVQRIIVEGGACTGVEVLRGGKTEVLAARDVVSAVDLNRAFFRLLGEGNVPVEWADKLRRSELAATMPTLYLGLNLPPEKVRAAFLGREELMYYPAVKAYSDSREDENYYRDAQIVIHSSSLISRDHAPEGKSSVQVYLQHAPAGWLGDWGIEDGKKTERYAQIKRMVIGQVLDLLENVIPDLKDRSLIEVCELGTPHTIERFTGSTNGCGCGFTMDGDCMNPRVRGKFFDRLPGIGHLYFCGQQACWPGAAGSALSSGMHMADVIK